MLYYRVALRSSQSATWCWKSSPLTLLDGVLGVLKLYNCMPREHIRVFLSTSPEQMETMLGRENQGLLSTAIPVDQLWDRYHVSWIEVRRLASVPEIPVAIDQPYDGRTYREIWYEEMQEVGYLHFAFYNGAMSAGQCQRLREAFQFVRQRPTRVIVLMGGSDFWSNGIHLNTIEAAADPAQESWRNIGAMNDLVRDIIT